MKVTFTMKDVEAMAEKALENACAYHACGQYKNMLYAYGEFCAYEEMLYDMGAWYDDDVIINEHCNSMIEILDEEIGKLTIKRL